MINELILLLTSGTPCLPDYILIMNRSHVVLNDLPIGVFDSGVGGLTVLRALQQSLPNESFLYLGDTARLPYGTKSPEMVIRYAQQVSEILIERGIKMLVVACNTASTLALASLQESFLQIPIIGVLEPGARAAAQVSKTGRIAVIATEATVKAGGYQNSIKKFRPDANVIAESCGLFVALAEEGLIDDPITEAVVKRYLEPLLNSPDHKPDCLVLGCTHFPVLLNAIKKVVNQKIDIIDSAVTTAELVQSTLKQLALSSTSTHKQSIKFLVTDAPERFAKVAKHFLGITINTQDIELVDFR